MGITVDILKALDFHYGIVHIPHYNYYPTYGYTIISVNNREFYYYCKECLKKHFGRYGIMVAVQATAKYVTSKFTIPTNHQLNDKGFILADKYLSEFPVGTYGYGHVIRLAIGIKVGSTGARGCVHANSSGLRGNIDNIGPNVDIAFNQNPDLTPWPKYLTRRQLGI